MQKFVLYNYDKNLHYSHFFISKGRIQYVNDVSLSKSYVTNQVFKGSTFVAVQLL
jgi:hypothetical protein